MLKRLMLLLVLLVHELLLLVLQLLLQSGRCTVHLQLGHVTDAGNRTAIRGPHLMLLLLLVVLLQLLLLVLLLVLLVLMVGDLGSGNAETWMTGQRASGATAGVRYGTLLVPDKCVPVVVVSGLWNVGNG